MCALLICSKKETELSPKSKWTFRGEFKCPIIKTEERESPGVKPCYCRGHTACWRGEVSAILLTKISRNNHKVKVHLVDTETQHTSLEVLTRMYITVIAHVIHKFNQYNKHFMQHFCVLCHTPEEIWTVWNSRMVSGNWLPMSSAKIHSK